MNKIYKLFINENIKTWKKISTKLLLIVILIALIGALGLVKAMEYMDNNVEENYMVETYDWRKDTEMELQSYKETLNSENLDEDSILSIKIQIEKCELALKYDIKPYGNDWKNSILDEIELERSNNNDEARVAKLIDIIEKDSFSEYIEIQKQIIKQDLDNKFITQQEYDDKIVILDVKSRNEIGKEAEQSYWRTMLINEIEQAQESLRTGLDNETNKLLTVESKKEKEDSIKMNIYRLDNNIPPVSYIEDDYRVMFEILGQLIVVAVIAISAIVIAGGQISSEISTGTIKFWALTPNKRWKILTAKILSLLFYIAVITLIMSLLTVALGNMFFETEGLKYIYVKDGEVKNIGNLTYMIASYFAKMIPVIIFVLFALMLSTITRNTAVAVSFSVAIYMGNGIFMMIINQFVKKDWIKFVPFNNLNIADKIFPNIENPFALVTGSFATSTSLQFSLAVLGVCAILMLVTMYDSFNKRDII